MADRVVAVTTIPALTATRNLRGHRIMAVENSISIRPAMPRPITDTVDHIEASLFRIEQATMIVEEFVELYQGDQRHRGVCDRVAFCGALIHENIAEIEKLLAELLFRPSPE